MRIDTFFEFIYNLYLHAFPILVFVVYLVPTTFSFNLYIKICCRYLDTVTDLCKQIDKDRNPKSF